jgi:hypothetical protein
MFLRLVFIEIEMYTLRIQIEIRTFLIKTKYVEK